MAGYRVKITLKDTKPPVWRRVVLPEKITFGELHKVIQTLFGWADCHMHAFTFEGDDVEIVRDLKDAIGDAYLEDQVLVDDFLKNHKYIDYTYDFGDDWEHRLVLESTEDEYENRYVSLVKAKGDNYSEDSGGIWEDDAFDEDDGEYAGDEDYALSERIPFDENLVRTRLEQMEFPVHEEREYERFGGSLNGEDIPFSISEEFKEVMQFYNDTGDMEKTAELFKETPEGMSLINSVLKYVSQMEDDSIEEPSKLEEAWYEWHDFYDRINSEIEDQQLAFDFDSSQKGSVQNGAIQVIKEKGKKTIAENLYAYADVKTLKNYCRYLGITYSENGRKEKVLRKYLAEIIEQAFMDHPEYIVMAFYRKDWNCFSEFICTGVFQNDPGSYQGISVAIGIGLVEVRYKSDVGVEYAYVRPALNLMDLMDQISDQSADDCLRACENFMDSMDDYLPVYSCISFSGLYKIYCEREKKRMEREDFYRNIFWNLRIKNLVKTSYIEGDIDNMDMTFVAIPEIDTAHVCSYIAEYMEDWDYKRYNKKAFSDMRKGFNVYYEDWDWMLVILKRLSEEREDVCTDINELFCRVINGCDLFELLDDIYDLFDVEGVVDSADVWFCAISVIMRTDLPMLKSRSREEYYQQMREWTPLLDPMGDMDWGYEEAEHIEELPKEVQMKMYKILSSKLEPKREVEEINKRYGDHAEWIYLLAQKYVEWEKPLRAHNLFEKLEKMCGDDKDVQVAVDVFYGYFDQMTDYVQREVIFEEEEASQSNVVPFVRSEKKVGRNDPCPCGSGKKYKHCCGK